MKLIKKWIRKLFCKNELPKGEILILWRDVDDKVLGWNAKADREEVVMSNVGRIMKQTKTRKLRQITGMEEKKGGSEYLY